MSYREGTDPNPVEAPATGSTEVPPVTGKQVSADSIRFAFMVVMLEDGEVSVVTDLASLGLPARPEPGLHSMYQMLCDVTDQVRTIRMLNDSTIIQRRLLQQANAALLASLRRGGDE